MKYDSGPIAFPSLGIPSYVDYEPTKILRPGTKGKYRCGVCKVKGHTAKICPEKG